MQKSKREMDNAVRDSFMNVIRPALEEEYGEVLQIGTNVFCVPALLEDGNECYVKFVVSIPFYNRDDEEFNGHAEAEEYEFNVEEKRKKKEKKK